VSHRGGRRSSRRLVRGNTLLTHEVPLTKMGDGSLCHAQKGREFCSTRLNIVIHLCDRACGGKRHSEGNDPQLPSAMSGTTTGQINMAGPVRVSTSSDLKH
jgi:hypothetical protein